MNWILILIYICMSVGGQILFKYGSNRQLTFAFKAGELSIAINWMCIVGAICYVGSFLLFLMLISKHNLNQINPILVGATYILSFLASIFILRENVTLLHGIGIAVIFIGVMLVVIGAK